MRRPWLAGGVVLVPLAAVAAVAVVPGALLFADVPGVLLPPMDPLPSVGSLSAARCGACHPDHWREWRESNHGKAMTDPLYVADLHAQGGAFFCNHCHAPLHEQQPRRTLGIATLFPRMVTLSVRNDRYQPELHEEGVTCVVCHQVDGAIEGPTGHPAPHPTRRSDALASGARCEACHTLEMTRIGRLQRPLMETVAEWREYRDRGGDQTCPACHLPEAERRPPAIGAEPGPAHSHRLRGPFDAEFIRAAVEVRRAEVARAGADIRAEVELFNATGHRFPTAEPHRRVEVALEVLDARGGVVGRAARFIERRVDLQSIRERPGEDTTLRPRETRTFSLAAPAVDGAERARVVLTFWLWEPEDEVARAAGLGAVDLQRELFRKEVALVP
jgi:hypothetical protein